MSSLQSLGIYGSRRAAHEPAPQHLLVLERPLQKLLEFTHRSIDDVVNCPLAKREVLGYYKLQQQIRRNDEAYQLDKWWGGVSTR